MLKALTRIALIASVSLPSIALAQNNENLQLPERRPSLDGNGVDLASGGLSVPVAAIAAGDQAFVRYQQENGWRDDVGGRISVNAPNVSVMIGDRVEHFSQSGPTYTPAEVTGSSLTFNGNVYAYTAGDGTYAEFNTYYSDQGGSQSGTAVPAARMTLLRAPTGHQQNYRYAVWSYSFTPHPSVPPVTLRFNRLDAISSNSGYRTEFTYRLATASSYSDMPDWLDAVSVKHFNTAVDSCPANTNGCVSAEARPSVAINAPGFSSTTGTYTDAAGNLTTVTASGSTITIQASGAPARVYTLSSGKVTQANIAGVNTSYTYADSGNERTTVRTTPSGFETFKFYIPTMQLLESTDVFGKKTTWSYNGARQLTSVTRPEGNYVAYQYDARGNVTQTQEIGKGGAGSITTSAAFHPTCSNFKTCNQPNSSTDARGNITNYSYDPNHGGVLSVTAPAPVGSTPRPETRYTYALVNGSYVPSTISACASSSSCAGTTDEVKTVFGYDARGNVASISKGDGAGTLTATTTMTYDAVGNRVAVDGPLPGSADITKLRYDVLRRLVGTIVPDPDAGGPLKMRATRTTYAGTLLTKVERGTVNGPSDSDWLAFSALETAETGYDTNSRPITQILKAGGSSYMLWQTSYDSLGRVECVAQRMNSAAFGSLPSSACALGTQGTSGPDRIARTTYDEANRVRKVQSAYGTSDQSDEVTNAYSDNGKLAHVTDAEGNRTSYEYDAFDRLLKTRYPVTTVGAGTSSPGTPPGDYEELGYDAASNITSRRLRDGTMLYYGYDKLDRRTSFDRPNTVWWETDRSYAYDLLGRLTSASDSFGYANSFEYDALSRRTKESSNWSGTMTSSYDLAGRRVSLAWPDGFYVTYDHLVTGETLAVREYGAASGVGVLATYSYDNLGRRTGITRGNGTTTSYGYDSVSRLASLAQDLSSGGYDSTYSFTYNPAGQIASATRSNDTYAWGSHYNVDRNYNVNGLNQTIASGATSIGYDGRGNLITSDGSSYGYTADNQLATAPGNTYGYDPLGRLSQETASMSMMQYDGSDMVLERDSDTETIRRRYVYGPGPDEPLLWYEGSGTSDRRWLHADERGSVVAVSDASGNAIAVNRYDEYGVPASTNIGRFQYTGQAWLPELGMYYYKARIYSPTLGRFMQTDPIEYADGMNMYGYVGGDPVNKTDPTGLCSRDEFSSALAIAEFEQCMTERAMAAAGSYLADSAEGTGFALAAMDSFESSRNISGFQDTYAEGIAVEAAAEQTFREICPGRYNCGNKVTISTARNIVSLLRNPVFMKYATISWENANKIGKEHAFGGVGFQDFKLTYGIIFGAKDAIGPRSVHNIANSGATIFFHTHQNGGNFVPSFSPGDLSNIKRHSFFGLVFSNNGWYFYDATKPAR